MISLPNLRSSSLTKVESGRAERDCIVQRVQGACTVTRTIAFGTLCSDCNALKARCYHGVNMQYAVLPFALTQQYAQQYNRITMHIHCITRAYNEKTIAQYNPSVKLPLRESTTASQQRGENDDLSKYVLHATNAHLNAERTRRCSLSAPLT
jgi:hypothetical protein